MDDQMPRIKSKRQVLQFKSSRLWLQTLMVGLCVLAASICSVLSATCPSLVPTSSTVITEQYNFSGFTNTFTYAVAGSSVSNSLYYLYRIYTPYNTAVRKVTASGSQSWVASFGFQPLIKSLSVDGAEQSVYLACYGSTLVVIKLAASDGSIVSQHQL